MSADMKTVAKQALVYALPPDKGAYTNTLLLCFTEQAPVDMEGTRPYKVNGSYYIFSDDYVRYISP
jgi:hypothetical protein